MRISGGRSRSREGLDGLGRLEDDAFGFDETVDLWVFLWSFQSTASWDQVEQVEAAEAAEVERKRRRRLTSSDALVGMEAIAPTGSH